MNTWVLKIPFKYQKKASSLKRFLDICNPIAILGDLTGLKWRGPIKISHKNLKWSAEFQEPNKIYVDFRKPVEYLALSIAHESAHLLLRKNNWSSRRDIKKLINQNRDYLSPWLENSFEYSIEQSLAVLLQLTYEEKTGISRFSKKRARELMKSMDVWKVGEKLLGVWPSYSKSRYKNIVGWVARVLS